MKKAVVFLVLVLVLVGSSFIFFACDTESSSGGWSSGGGSSGGGSSGGGSSGGGSSGGGSSGGSSQYGSVELYNDSADIVGGFTVFARLYASIMDVTDSYPSWHQLSYRGSYTYSSLSSGSYTLEWKVGDKPTVYKKTLSVGDGGKRKVTFTTGGTSATVN